MPTDFVSEFKAALGGKNRSTLRLGELAYEFEQSPDSDYESLRAVLAADGFDAPVESTINRYKHVHAYWTVKQGIPRGELERVGMTKLYAIAAHLKKTSGDPLAWLEKAKNTSREQLEALIADQPLNERRRQITGPASVIEAFEQGTKRLYKIVNHPHESMIPALEIWAAVMLEGNPESLKRFWNTVHGESSES